jgi:hypothetical protein
MERRQTNPRARDGVPRPSAPTIFTTVSVYNNSSREASADKVTSSVQGFRIWHQRTLNPKGPGFESLSGHHFAVISP